MTIWDQAVFEALKDRPQCNEYATVILNALEVIGHDRSVSEHGYGRVIYATITQYHADFRVNMPIQVFVRLTQLADAEWLSLVMESK